jgi:hypothetical protein
MLAARLAGKHPQRCSSTKTARSPAAHDLMVVGEHNQQLPGRVCVGQCSLLLSDAYRDLHVRRSITRSKGTLRVR